MDHYWADYRRIMSHVTDNYRIKGEMPKSLPPAQILTCLKIFIQKDKGNEGFITVSEMEEIIKDSLGFRASCEEIRAILRNDTDGEFTENIANEKVNFGILIQVVDILKREKLILVRMSGHLNYFIYGLLMVLIMVYITVFYSDIS
jgi:hypothetical protein